MRRREMAVALLLAALSPATLAAQPQATDQLIKFFQSRVARDPDDVFSYNKIGAVYVQKARESGDITYYALADVAARRSTQLVPQGPSAAAATTLLALVHHARHEFREALGQAQQALQLGGADVSPHAIAGDALVELGDYDGASRAYSRLLGLTGPRHPHGRLAYLRFLQSDAEAALAGMRRAVEAARGDSTSREPLAWSQAQLGKLAKRQLAELRLTPRERLAAGGIAAGGLDGPPHAGERRLGVALQEPQVRETAVRVPRSREPEQPRVRSARAVIVAQLHQSVA